MFGLSHWTLWRPKRFGSLQSMCERTGVRSDRRKKKCDDCATGTFAAIEGMVECDRCPKASFNRAKVKHYALIVRLAPLTAMKGVASARNGYSAYEPLTHPGYWQCGVQNSDVHITVF